MDYEFADFRIHLTDKRPGFGNDAWRWADIEITLAHQERDTHHRVQVPVCIRYDASRSIASAKGEALDHAKTILQEALAVLQANGLEQLMRMEGDARARGEARQDAEMERIGRESLSKARRGAS
jgi:hypothetical protein